MKLILASDLSFLLKYGYDLTGIPKSQMKIGYVNTAAKNSGEKTLLFMENVKKIIRENGYSFKEIDIEGKSENELRDFFSDKNVIHIDGGSTAYLLNAIRITNFDKILKELLESGLIYIGTSAGAAVMGPIIKSGSETMDIKKEELNALNYVPFVIKAHYIDDKKDEYKKKTKDLGYSVKFLRDGQGILVEDDKYTFVGDGEEVRL